MADSLGTAMLFSGLISEIKAYPGNDPLLPWLRGIKKMKEALPPQLLKEKLPRFLQKCARTFETHKRYRNDLRYLRVWIQLMDFVDDPKGILRTMEANQIGMKRALFYQAYALYYEKFKRFEEAEKMYHLGVQNLAEPAGELHKSYEQFLLRMQQYMKRRTRKQGMRASERVANVSSHQKTTKIVDEGENITNGEGCPTFETQEIRVQASQRRTCNVRSEVAKEHFINCFGCEKGNLESRKDYTSTQVENESSSFDVGAIKVSSVTTSLDQKNIQEGLEKRTSRSCDDTVVVKFVGSAIVGKPPQEAEDACHHGLVDPTINMKEAMNAINGMFREPLDIDGRDRRSKSKQRVEQPAHNGFDVFVDESLDDRNGDSNTDHAASGTSKLRSNCPVDAMSFNQMQDPIKIFVDGEDEINGTNKSSSTIASTQHGKALREDTVICRYVGSTVFGEPEVENACHNGLVDPTINLKQAMDEINGMFGKPLDYFKTTKLKKPGKLLNVNKGAGGFAIFKDDELEQKPPEFVETNKLKKPSEQLNEKQEASGFVIFADENLGQQLDFIKPCELKLPNEAHIHKKDAGNFLIFTDQDEEQKQQPRVGPSSSVKLSSECGLFEPTLFTKEAIDDINEMFGRPLDF